MTEDELLNVVAVEQVLSKLPEDRRLLLLLTYRLYRPSDWIEEWPPTLAAIGRYLGLRYRQKPLAEATIRYQRDATLRFLRQSFRVLEEESEENDLTCEKNPNESSK